MRTGKAKQHYLLNEVIAYIKWKTKKTKKKSQSAYINSELVSMLENDTEYQIYIKPKSQPSNV